MNELINLNSEDMTVSAREIHEKVGSTERFSAWFERQLQFGFEEGMDYTGCKTFNTQAHQELQDYRLTIDMAKQICMVQKNERARQIRQYLIDLEKAWNTPELVMARGLQASQRLLEQKEKIIKELALENKEMKPKALFADAVSTSRTSILVGDLAKLISQNGVDIGQKRLFSWLRERGYLIKDGASKNMPTQRSMDMNLMEVKESTIANPDGSVRITRTTKVTGKGQIYFVDKFLGSANA